MKALTFTIHLLEPLLVTKPGGGDPNSSTAFSYIPGSIIRGVLIGRYLTHKNPDYDLSGDTTARRLFFEGAVRYLNAWPLLPTGQRTLPTPLSWRVEKEPKNSEIYDLAVELNNNLKQPQAVKEDFYYPSDDKAIFHKTRRHINIHTYRVNRSGQTKGIDSVFRYDALAVGQSFGGVIVADDTTDLETARQWLTPPEFHIGGSHQAGYGRVQITEVRVDHQWQFDPQADNDPPETIIVTCLSDTLIRDDKTGAYTGDLSSVILQTHKHAYTRQVIIGNFNRTWGLPGVQVQAIQAGSVFVYDFDQVLWERLRQLELTGVGERRAEGFGGLAIALQRQEKWQKEQYKEDADYPLPPQLSGDSADLAARMSERLLRTRLDNALAETLSRLRLTKPRPSQTQLARLRGVVRHAITKNQRELVQYHLNNLTSSTARQFEKSKVEDKPLKSWLEALIKTPSTVWDILKIKGVKGPEIGRVQAVQTDLLANDYALRLIYSLLHQASKEEADHD